MRMRSRQMASEINQPYPFTPPKAEGARSHWLRQSLRQHGDKMMIPVVIAIGIALWAGLVAWQEYPVFILPGPEVVWRKLLALVADGSLLRHARVTLVEVALGLLLGLAAAFVLGYLLGKNETIERL